jgi:hypothetical protein
MTVLIRSRRRQGVENRSHRRDTVAVIVMPIVVVALTVGAGSWLAVALQDRSFQKNEIFKVRLQRVVAAEGEASTLRREVAESLRLVKMREEFMRNELKKADANDRMALAAYYHKELQSSASIRAIKRSAIDLAALAEDTVGAGQAIRVQQATNAYAVRVDTFLECVRANDSLAKSCADDNVELNDLLRAVVIAHGRRADALIQAKENEGKRSD